MMKMHDRLLRRREVEKITGIGRSSIYRLMKKGKFPRGVRIGSKVVRWRLSEIMAWLKSLPVVGMNLARPTQPKCGLYDRSLRLY